MARELSSISKKRGKKHALRKRNDQIQPNQWTGTAQQERFLLFYLDPKSKTFANPYESAMEAGYSESYARVIATPSVSRRWIKEARNIAQMEPEHIVQALQAEARNFKDNRGSDRIRALELIAKMQGLFVEKKIVGHVNIEQAIQELE